MVAGNYALRSLESYTREISFFAEYFPDIEPENWTENHVRDYMTYLKMTLGSVSYAHLTLPTSDLV